MGEAPQYKSVYFNLEEGADSHEISADLMGDAATASVTINKDMKNRISKMMESLNYIVIVVILSAGALAFIVLYNLTNINITERIRETYGPYQRPNGKLGALTTFTYKALHQETLHVYGDGSVVRDYIYIDDAIDAMLKIAFGSPQYHIYNIGSGTGTSLNDLIDHLRSVLDIRIDVNYEKKRSVDLPANYLDITRYETEFGTLVHTPIDDGIRRTADFLKAHS